MSSKILLVSLVLSLVVIALGASRWERMFDELFDELEDKPSKLCPRLCDLDCPHGLDTDVDGCPAQRCARLAGDDPLIANGVSTLENISKVCRYTKVCGLHCPAGFLSYKGCPICKCYKPPKYQAQPVKNFKGLICKYCQCGVHLGDYLDGKCTCIPFREPKAFGFKCDQPKDYCDRLCDYGLKKAVRLVKLDPTKSLRCPTCHCDKTPILADYLKELEAIEQETGKKQIREIDEPGEDY